MKQPSAPDAKSKSLIEKYVGNVPVVHSLSPEAQASLDGAVRVMKNVEQHMNGEISTTMKAISMISDSCQKTAEYWKEILLSLPPVIGMVISGYLAIKKRSLLWSGVFGTCGALVFGITSFAILEEKFQALLATLNNYAGSDEGAEPQACDESIFTPLITLVFSYLSFQVTGKDSKVATTMAFVKECANWDRRKDNIQSIFTSVCNLFQKAYNFIRTRVFGLDAIEYNMTVEKDVNEWCNSVLKVSEEAYKGDLKINRPNAVRLQRLEMQGSQLMTRKYLTPTIANSVKQALGYHASVLTKVMGPFSGIQSDAQGPRHEPLLLCFWGKPGTGKTLNMMPFVDDIAMQSLSPEECKHYQKHWGDYCYSREIEHEFADGYRGQRYFYVDDAWNTRDVAGQPTNEYTEAIRLGHIFPHIFHMADLAQKGTTYAQIDLGVYTTNATSMKPQSIIEPEAVHRRFMFIHAGIKAKYAIDPTANPLVRRPDFSLIRGLNYNDDIAEYHWSKVEGNEFRLLNWDDKTDLPRGPVSLDDIKEWTLKELHNRKTFFDNYTDYRIDKMRNAYAKRFQCSMDDKTVPLMEPETYSDTTASRGAEQQAAWDIPAVKSELQMTHLEEDAQQYEPPELETDEFIEETAKTIEEVAAEINSMPDSDEANERIDTMLDLMNVCGEDRFSASRFLSHLRRMVENLVPDVFLADRLTALVRIRAHIGSHQWNASMKQPWSVWKKWIFSYVDSVKRMRDCFAAKTVVARGLTASVIIRLKNSALTVRMRLKSFMEYVRGFTKRYPKTMICIVACSVLPLLYGASCAVSGLSDLLMEKACGPEFTTNYRFMDNKVNMLKKHDKLLKYADANGVCLHRITDRRTGIVSHGYLDKQHYGLFEKTHCFEVLDESQVNLLDMPGALFDKGAKVLDLVNKDGTPDATAVEPWFGFWKKDPVGVKEVEGNEPQKYDVTGRVSNKPRTMRAKPTGAVGKQQAGDFAAFEIAKKIINQNTYNMFWMPAGMEPKFLGTCTFVKGRVVVFPRHFITLSNRWMALGHTTPLTKVILEGHNAENYIELQQCDLYHEIKSPLLNGTDLYFARLPISKVQPRKDISNHFARESTLDHEMVVYEVLLASSIDGAYNFIQGEGIKELNHLVTSQDGDYTVERTMRYPFHTQQGDCGSHVYILSANFSSGKLIGIHVSGDRNSSDGFATILTYEMIQQITSEGQPQAFDFEISELTERDRTTMIQRPLYRTSIKSHQATHSKFKRSALHGAWGPPTMALARLTPTKNAQGVLIDPIAEAIRGYQEQKPMIDVDLAKAVSRRWFSEMRSTEIFKGDRRILTHAEAILGIPGESFYDAIPRATSAGYPIAQMLRRGSKGKQMFFGTGEEYDLDNDDMKALLIEVDLEIKEMSEGRRPLHISTLNLKDEKRKLKKVEDVNTRSIMGAPLNLLIIMRMYFMPFSVWMCRNRIRNHSAVGINPLSHEWNQLARHLSCKSTKVVAGDYVHFDFNFTLALIMAILDEIIQPYYNDEHYEVRKQCLIACVHGKYVIGDLIFELIDIFGSGQFGTAIFQTLHNGIYIRMAFAALSDNSMNHVQTFSDYVSPIYFGDDHVLNISDIVIEWFNLNTIKQYMETVLLQGYTSDRKEETNPPPHRFLNEITFLKRAFRYERLVLWYVAPLSLATILEMPYWTKKGLLEKQITKDNVDTALDELSLHTDEIYYKYGTIIQNASYSRLGYHPTLEMRQTRFLRYAAPEVEA